MCEGAVSTCEFETLTHPRFHRIAHSDYEKALRRTFWEKASRGLGQQSTGLLSLTDVWQGGGTYLNRGISEVEIDAIVGSSGRYRDFNPDFLPIRRENDDRWVNVAQAHYEGVQLPPVHLYKVRDIYLVEDGNHRISVARVLGLAYIQAKVIEIAPER